MHKRLTLSSQKNLGSSCMSVLLRLTYQHICQGNEKIIYDQLSILCLPSGSLLKRL